jgi:hypothetical protein
MKDKVTGANVLKPDIAGTTNPADKDVKLWWKPPFGERSSMMELPVEVQDNWKQLVRQGARYACCLSNAIPLRHFSLVLGYNYKDQELRFLVFHAGGLTASTGLRVYDPGHQKDILRLFLALLTWKSPGDAGIPEWSNDVHMFVQRDRDDKEGLRMEVKEVFYNRVRIRGRRHHIVRLQHSTAPVSSSTPPTAPRVIVQLNPRRSQRIAEQETRQKSGTPSQSKPSSARKTQSKPASAHKTDSELLTVLCMDSHLLDSEQQSGSVHEQNQSAMDPEVEGRECTCSSKARVRL